MKKTYFVFLCIFLFTGIAFCSETLEGHWEGSIRLPTMELAVLIDFFPGEAGKWKGTIDIPAQAAKGLPLTNISIQDSKTLFEIENVPGKPTFSGELSSDRGKIAGDFTQSNQTFTFELQRKTAAPAVPVQKKSDEEIQSEIRNLVKSEMDQWHVPGLALALIKDGKVWMSEGFGTRDSKNKQRVTPDTLFAIGSSSKAFTATLVGIAVDEGKLKWDQPVKSYLPEFAMHDPFASERMTPTDLLSHDSGLPRHDLLWYNNQFTRKELFDRLKYLEPNKDFREVFQYQNLMFMTAGYLTGEVEGSSWEDLVRQKIFQPLGMASTNVSVTESQKTSDYALPYRYADNDPEKTELKEIPFRNIDSVGPAGSINSNARDMSRWVLLNLNHGTYEGKTIVSKTQLSEIHSPHMVIRGGIFSQLLSFPETPYVMYGMGWFIQPYRGHKLLHHGGNIDGFSAMVSFMPDDKTGIVILTNLDGNLMVDSLMFEIYDRLLGLDPVDWNSRYRLIWEQLKAAQKESAKKESEVLKKPGTKPSHALSDYAGKYENVGYGKLEILRQGQDLSLTYGELSSALGHWHYDVFNAADDPLTGAKVTFLTNVRGDIDRVSISMEPSVPEIVFTMKAPESMSDPAFLREFAGEYDLMGLTVTVVLRNEKELTLTVPGQPTYVLEPYRGSEFNIKDLAGYSVRFIQTQGKTSEILFIQPGTTISAKKK